MFEVGKKYKNRNSGNITTAVWKNGQKTLLEYEDGGHLLILNSDEGWTKYKEPVTITRYAVVFTPEGSSIPKMTLNDNFVSEEAILQDLWPGHTIHQIIPVTATIEG